MPLLLFFPSLPRYDFLVFAYQSVVISVLFFPSNNRCVLACTPLVTQRALCIVPSAPSQCHSAAVSLRGLCGRFCDEAFGRAYLRVDRRPILSEDGPPGFHLSHGDPYDVDGMPPNLQPGLRPTPAVVFAPAAVRRDKGSLAVVACACRWVSSPPSCWCSRGSSRASPSAASSLRPWSSSWSTRRR